VAQVELDLSAVQLAAIQFFQLLHLMAAVVAVLLMVQTFRAATADQVAVVVILTAQAVQQRLVKEVMADRAQRLKWAQVAVVLVQRDKTLQQKSRVAVMAVLVQHLQLAAHQ
jgi:hypothetical protein